MKNVTPSLLRKKARLKTGLYFLGLVLAVVELRYLFKGLLNSLRRLR